jgi:hypothetical protein
MRLGLHALLVPRGPHLAANAVRGRCADFLCAVLYHGVLCCAVLCCAMQGNGDDEGHQEGGRGRQRPAPELEDTGVTGERAMGKGELR